MIESSRPLQGFDDDEAMLDAPKLHLSGDDRGRHDKSTCLEDCQWLTRESFVVCRAEDRNPQDKSLSLSVLGYSEEEQAYTYASFDGSGGSRTLHAWVHGDQWVFAGGRDRPGRSTRWQATITPNEKGFHFRQEVSAHGSPWATNFEMQYLWLP